MTQNFLLFRNKNFLSYWLGYSLSQLGDEIFFITIALLIVNLTNKGIVMGTFLMLMGIPRIVFMLIGGVVVDKLDAKKLMLGSDLFRGFLLVAVFFLVLTQRIHNWELYVLAVIFGLVDAVYWPAASSFRQRLVEKEHYTQSSGLIVSSMQTALILGPILGALLVHSFGFSYGILCDAISFLISFFTLIVTKTNNSNSTTPKPSKQTEKKAWVKDLQEGLHFVRVETVLLAMIVVGFLANAGANSVDVGLPFLAHFMGINMIGYGRMAAGWGIGGILGAVALSIFSIRNASPRLILFSFVLQGLAILFLGFIKYQWESIALLAVCGIASAGIQIFSSSLYKTLIPHSLMGRVSSVLSLVSMGSTPFMQAVAGWVVDTFGVQVLYLFGGSVEVVAVLMAFFVPAVQNYGKKPENADAIPDSRQT